MKELKTKKVNVQNMREKMICFRAMLPMAMWMLTSGTVFASGGTFDGVVSPIVSLLQSATGPALSLVGAAGTLYCIILGVKFAQAEEPQDREKAKTHLKNAIIGFVLIFVLIVALHFGMKAMTNWASQQTGVNYNVQ